jgi:hypothetical protein
VVLATKLHEKDTNEKPFKKPAGRSAGYLFANGNLLAALAA